MASGSSGCNNSGSKVYNFAADDILCSYEDYGNEEASNGTHSDPAIGSGPPKEFHKSRMARSSMFPAPTYSPPQESFNQEVMSTVEKTMKKYADNLMRFLEGISSRLSQLELYCYNLDKSIGEMRSDLVRDHGEADSKLKSLEKHLQEVRRSVQILRDKQELAETQKELAKLQLAQKESSSPSHSQQHEERAALPAPDPKMTDNTADMRGQQFALALAHQVAPRPSLPARPMEQQQPVAPSPPPLPQSLSQSQAYYLPPGHSQQHEERAGLPAPDPKMTDNTADMRGQQLALALPHQVAPQPSLPARPMEQQQPVAPPPPPLPQSLSQSQAYYLPPGQIPNPPAPTQPSQAQYLPSDSQYRTPQMQEISRLPAQQPQSQVNQAPQVHPLPQYQQQWPQQLPQQGTPPQSAMQPQIRPPSTVVYPPYLTSQSANPSPPETLPNSMPMQVPYSGISQPVATRAEAIPYGYGGLARTIQQQPPPQQLKNTFGIQPSDGYPTSAPHPSLSGNAYMTYEGDGGRIHHPPQQSNFPQGSYPTTSVPHQNASANPLVRPPQFMRNHPYTELIDKLVNMGYRGDHIASVIQRLEESGQPVDFNAVLNRLNGHSSGGSQRGWSG